MNPGGRPRTCPFFGFFPFLIFVGLPKTYRLKQVFSFLNVLNAMNLFESVICHDYGMSRAARGYTGYKTNGIHMVGICWVANFLTLLGGAVIYFVLNQKIYDLYEILAALHYWEAAGRIVLIIILLCIHMMAFAAYGGKVFFRDIVHRFVALEPDDQKAVVQRGGMYFYFSVTAFFIVLGVLAVLIRSLPDPI